jgi:hypothetical protein
MLGMMGATVQGLPNSREAAVPPHLLSLGVPQTPSAVWNLTSVHSYDGFAANCGGMTNVVQGAK